MRGGFSNTPLNSRIRVAAVTRRLQVGSDPAMDSGRRLELEGESDSGGFGDSQTVEAEWDGVESAVDWARLPAWMRQPLGSGQSTGPPGQMEWLGGSDEE